MKDNNNAADPKANAGEKLTYHKPELKIYGVLRTITLNPTPAQADESGLGIGYADTIPIESFDDTSWSRRDVEPSGGRGSRER